MADTTKPKPFVFVLMPFNPAFDDTYRLAIKPACDNAGAYAERVDEQIFDGSILQRIFNQIAKADIVLSDLTGKNSNVFYETGYAHALGKRTLLLTRTAEDIPFDLKHFPHVVYGGRLSDLLPELERRLRWYIENPEKTETTQGNLVVRVNSIPLIEDAHIVFKTTSRLSGIDLTIEVHNRVDRELRTIECQIGIITPRIFDHAKDHKAAAGVAAVNVEHGQRLHLVEGSFRLLPGRWVTVELAMSASSLLWPGDFQFAARIFTESGCFDFPFAVVVEQEEIGDAANPGPEADT